MSSPQLVFAASSVSSNQKWLAALIGLAAILVLYIIAAVMNASPNPLKLVDGKDGKASTSKFQWAVWLVVIIFAYVFLWFIRTRENRWGAISEIPANLLLVLGFSTITAVAAKGIVVGYTGAGSLAKGDATDPSTNTATQKGGLLQDDDGTPELAKIQMVAFTFVAIGIFLYNVYHQAKGSHPTANLPNIDRSLLVLMGLSQGGYLGKKLVTTTTPLLNTLKPRPAWVGAEMTLAGSSFGQGGGASRLLLDGSPIPTKSWTDSEIKFDIPDHYPKADEVDWPEKKLVHFGIDLGGGIRGNDVNIMVFKTQPKPQAGVGGAAPAGGDAEAAAQDQPDQPQTDAGGGNGGDAAAAAQQQEPEAGAGGDAAPAEGDAAAQQQGG